MTEQKYTPGPWEAEGVRVVAETMGETNGWYELAETVTDFTELQTAVANARLIAAAPELLEACEDALACLLNLDSVLRWNIEQGDHIEEAYDVMGKLKARLNKAKGL